jgi:hypothetical protein
MWAAIGAPSLTIAAFWTTISLRSEWLGFFTIGIGAYVQKELVRYGFIAPPMAGGHMPDFSFQLEFDTIAVFLLILTAEYALPSLKRKFTKLKNRNA